MPYARIKPHEPLGHRIKMYAIDGVRFRLIRGWTRITPSLADRLPSIADRNGKPVFDVVESKVEADALDKNTGVVTVAEVKAADPAERLQVGRSDAPEARDLPVDMDLSARKIKLALDKLAAKGELGSGDIEAIYTYELSHASRKGLLSDLEKRMKATTDEG